MDLSEPKTREKDNDCLIFLLQSQPVRRHASTGLPAADVPAPAPPGSVPTRACRSLAPSLAIAAPPSVRPAVPSGPATAPWSLGVRRASDRRAAPPHILDLSRPRREAAPPFSLTTKDGENSRLLRHRSANSQGPPKYHVLPRANLRRPPVLRRKDEPLVSRPAARPPPPESTRRGSSLGPERPSNSLREGIERGPTLLTRRENKGPSLFAPPPRTTVQHRDQKADVHDQDMWAGGERAERCSRGAPPPLSHLSPFDDFSKASLE